jgi:hypothetical protein
VTASGPIPSARGLTDFLRQSIIRDTGLWEFDKRQEAS